MIERSKTFLHILRIYGTPAYTNPEDGIKLFRADQQKFDLIITDGRHGSCHF
jgi:hypothetical protein